MAKKEGQESQYKKKMKDNTPPWFWPIILALIVLGILAFFHIRNFIW